RAAAPDLPEMAQYQVLRHYLRYSQMTLGMDLGSDISEGTCTMKYSPKMHEELIRGHKAADLHPWQDEDTLQGLLQIVYDTGQYLQSISGMDAFTLQPGGGSHAVFTNACVMRRYFEARGELDQRNEMITTIFSHPCDAATPMVAGFKVITVMPDENGYPDLEAFRAAVSENGRRLIENPLIIQEGRHVMDYEGLERSIDANTKAIILSSPHNPVGRVWEKPELERLVEICDRHGIIIISDEIHSDLILGDIPHTCIASLSAKAAAITVTLNAPNKTFNIAGLTMGSAIIADEGLRRGFAAAVADSGIGVSNIFGNVALEAAYDRGEDWLEELLAYLRGNQRYVAGFFAEKLPEFKLSDLEGTYLAWIDCRGLGLDDAGLKEFFTKKAGLWLDEGTKFGTGGSGFMRLNMACPRSLLVEALARLEKAMEEKRRI
ncbi:MAG: hypothetical protein CVV53_06860, partial [Spirochaetae bacterium HGW-Spirochaetae-9]